MYLDLYIHDHLFAKTGGFVLGTAAERRNWLLISTSEWLWAYYPERDLLQLLDLSSASLHCPGDYTFVQLPNITV